MPTNSLTTAEIESVRYHLGYGNITEAASPYTPDGWLDLFEQVIAPSLSRDTETTATAPATLPAGAATMTLADVTNMAPYTRLVVDVGDDVEVVEVRAIAGMSVSVKLAKPHDAPCPVAILSGTMRLRLLLHAADRSWQVEHGSKIIGSAGIKQLGRGEIEYFPGGAQLANVTGQYRQIQRRIASLVRVPVCGDGGSRNLEVY